MKKEFRSVLFSSAILFTLLFNAVYPGVARADGGTTTPVSPTQAPATTDTSVPSTQAPVTTDTSVPSTQPPAASDTPVPTTPVVTDTVVSATTAAPTEVTPSATDTATATATATAQALVQVPSGTQVVAVDSNGNVQPLATQAAANIIATGDPIWCPAGASPVPGAGGCTASYTDLYSLVNAIVTLVISQPNQNGTIWISAGTDASASNITIDGSALTTWANYTLTLQGGWSGSSVGTISGTSDFSKSIGISNWKNDVAVNDVIVSNTNTTGLGVDTTGNITVHQVSSSNNTAHGAFLSTSGAGHQISVDNSTFNNNKLYGLNAMDQGDVTLNNVIANNNTSGGVSLSNSSGIGSVSISVNGTNTFNNNGGNGIQAYSNGNVTLNNVTANNNTNDGASLSTVYGTGNITLTGTSQFNANHNYGLDVISKGDITLNNVTANGNTYDGAYLDNTYGTGNLSVSTSVFGDSSELTGNGWNGLEAYSNGTATLANVTADGNYYDGMDVGTTGNITLDTVTANHNGDNGALLGPSCFGECPIPNGDISVSNSTFSTNANDGVDVYSGGNLTLNNVIASNNSHVGAWLENDYKGSVAGVMVSNSVFNSNGFGGVGVFSNGDINLNNVTSSRQFSGAGLFTSGTVTITCSRFISNSHDGFQFGVPTLNLNGVSFSGNGTDYLYTGSGSPSVFVNSVNCNPGGGNTGSGGGLPIFIIPVTGVFDCTSYSANEVVLPDQDHILLPCPTAGDATLTGQTSDQLPGMLDAKYTFVSAFDTKVTPSLNGFMTVSFKIPAGKENANFTILYWDGSKWEDLGGTKTPDGFFQVQTDKTGTFVLVTK